MRRTPLARKAPLSRGKPLKRRKPISPANKKRRAARREEQFGERAVLVRAMRCLCASAWSVPCRGDVQAAHVRSRGAGGSRRDLVPLCERHHREQHDRGITTFQTQYGLDLNHEAARIASDLDRQGVP